MTIDSILPDPQDPRLSRSVEGVDETGQPKSISVIEERPLTIYLNSQEIVTAMTIGDHPEYLALGFLLNQGMLKATDQVTGIDYDEELEVAVVRTAGTTDVEDKLEKKTRTSGCAVGTVFGDMMAGLEGLALPDTPVHTSTFYDLSYQINHTPSLYMETGAIHGTALCQGRQILAYMEDVGRHNAVDKIAGWMYLNNITAADKSAVPESSGHTTRAQTSHAWPGGGGAGGCWAGRPARGSGVGAGGGAPVRGGRWVAVRGGCAGGGGWETGLSSAV